MSVELLSEPDTCRRRGAHAHENVFVDMACLPLPVKRRDHGGAGDTTIRRPFWLESEKEVRCSMTLACPHSRAATARVIWSDAQADTGCEVGKRGMELVGTKCFNIIGVCGVMFLARLAQHTIKGASYE
jgi:hypothetical protein